MNNTFKKLRDLLDVREQRHALLLFGMMLVLGVIEAAGVASIMPLMAVLLDPGLIHSNQILAATYKTLGFTTTSSFLILLVAVVFLILLGRIVFTALTQYAIARFSHMRSYALSTRLLENYLRRPYSWFLNRHSADLGKSVLSEVDQVVSGSLIPALQFVSQAVVTVFLLGLLISLEPKVAISGGLSLGGFYLITYVILRNSLGRLGKERLQANQQRFKIAQEALSGIKEVKISGLEHAYLRRYRSSAFSLATRRAALMVAREMPRHVLEAMAFGGILLIVLIMLTRAENNLAETLPVLAVFAFAGMRLLPALHKLYQSSAGIKFGQAAVKALHADMVEKPSLIDAPDQQCLQPMSLCNSIELADVTFKYPCSERSVLTNLSLSITANTTVGFVGGSGAGKTTIVDIILGLLAPQSGELRIDGKEIIAKNLRNWQSTIGYVPQHIFLADETIAGNIAFGMPPDRIDYDAVKRAARIAELHDFVTYELPQNYDTMVGERGIRLSGGQRQRIGIARALYHDPNVLVLDEATSALDGLTEKALMETISKLAHRKTILLVAHRLSAVRSCDQIFLIERGRLKTSGSYEELKGTDRTFRKMTLAQ